MSQVRTTHCLAILFLMFTTVTVNGQGTTSMPLNEQLWEAVRKGDVALIRDLLDKGADVNAKFRYGATALFKAADKGDVEVVKLLLERGADTSVKDTFYGATAMTWALNKKSVAVVRALLEKEPGSADEVLFTGAREGNADLVRVALAKGDVKPHTMTTALVVASSENKADIVEILKSAGAQPPFEIDATTLQTYAGKYKSEQRGDITLSIKDGKLFAHPAAQSQPFALMALDKVTFKRLAFDGLQLTFTAEGDKITGFTMKQGSNTIVFKKQE